MCLVCDLIQIFSCNLFIVYWFGKPVLIMWKLGLTHRWRANSHEECIFLKKKKKKKKKIEGDTNCKKMQVNIYYNSYRCE